EAPAEAADAEAPDLLPGGKAIRVPAAERRAAALALVAVWRDLLRDVAAIAAGEPRLVRDVELLDDLERAAGGTDARDVGAALREGPRGARVEDVTEAWSDSTGEFGSFTIRSGVHGGD